MKFSTLIQTSYLYLPRRELTDSMYSLLVDSLTVRSAFVGNSEPIPLFDNSKRDWFGVPLYHKGIAGPVNDHRILTEPFRFAFTPKKANGSPGALWASQVEVMKKFTRALELGVTGILLKAPPGAGKTVMLICMMQKLAQPTLIIVPRSNLVKQWRDRLVRHSSLNDHDIGEVNGTRVLWRHKKVVIGLVHSLALNRLGADFRKSFGLVMFDEVDRSVPPATFAPVVGMFPSKYRIGCSATIERRDRLHVVLQKHIGQITIEGVAGAKDVMVPSVVLVEYARSSGAVPPHIPRMNRRGILLSKLAKNPARNMLLAHYINKLYQSGRRVVVLSDRVAHLQLLRELVATRYGISRSDTGLYVGAVKTGKGRLSKQKRRMTPAEWKHVAATAKVIFGTYQIFALGTDIPELAGLVYATPQSEIIQSKGRIERAFAGKKQPIVIDMYDMAYEDARNWAGYRMRSYAALGMEVRRIRWKEDGAK